MIGFLSGEVLFSDGRELILKTTSGIGYQVHFYDVLTEGSQVDIFISHVIREAGQDLFGFKTLRDKKLFEILNSVKGVGPKSAFSLITSLGHEQIIQSIQFENKKVLTKAPGIGAKAAAQICLDLGNKIQKVLMYSSAANTHTQVSLSLGGGESLETSTPQMVRSSHHALLDDTLLACKELGFKEESVLPLAKKIMEQNDIVKAEQLIHLVLKEM